jgi:nucleotide-binding universal stress UspA family protein
MKRIIVPIDFSATAANAAVFAGNLAAFYGAELWLYHAYDLPVATGFPLITADQMQEAADYELGEFRKTILADMRVAITIQTVAEASTLLGGLAGLAESLKPDMVVMGITGRNKLMRLVVGSNTVRAIQQLPYPVLVVPGNARFEPVRRIGFACDFEKVAETTPLDQLKKLVVDFRADLYVLNVVPQGEQVPDAQLAEGMYIGEALKAYEANFQVILSNDVAEGIDWFASNNQLDWVVVIPKKHNLMQKLFGRSHTKDLLYHTHLPVLCMHE